MNRDGEMVIGQKEAAFIIEELEKISHKLTDWEVKFVDSIEHQIDDHKRLSPKQLETINNIWEKY